MIEAALGSCDDHFDLDMLPANVLAERMSGRWGERAGVDIPADGPASWIANGLGWRLWSGQEGGDEGSQAHPHRLRSW